MLSIAGTDPSGGAGIQADLKSIAALGGYGMAAVTALVAQNTQGVRSVHTPPPSFLMEQLRAVSDDVTIDAVKIGMLGSSLIAQTVGEWLAEVTPPIVVIDPVMIATSGDRLLDTDAEKALRSLLPQASLITPNIPELAVLLNEPVASSWDEALAQGKRASTRFNTTILVKGGHLSGERCPDALVNVHRLPSGHETFQVSGPRIHTKNTHGTGCSLSSAMATLQSRTNNWEDSLVAATEWLRDAIAHSDELRVGSGSGPVHHFHHLWSLAPHPAQRNENN
ncbi:bifunctional hydroxymethylpyrimidine kinase/phosphomethylpyrimidine kinase [Lysinibacter sp. HNR]|uniref:bifunctional hydroxymethylpyrimidine kinase/phosphomethylpyrimidine kinase n=1 Tax=Lysinibacter sp. HNR TaxID=3031408 RepID=UPI00325A6B8F